VLKDGNTDESDDTNHEQIDINRNTNRLENKIENVENDIVEHCKARNVSFTIKSPPSQVVDIHQQIILKIQTILGKNDFQMKVDKNGRTLVTVVNASRTQADIERDLIAADLTDTEAANVILLRILPTKDPKQKVAKEKADNFLFDLPLLFHPKSKKLYDCANNTRQFEELVDYLRLS